MVNLKCASVRRSNIICLCVIFAVIMRTRYELQTCPVAKQASDFRGAIGRHTGNAGPIDRATAGKRCDQDYTRNQATQHDLTNQLTDGGLSVTLEFPCRVAGPPFSAASCSKLDY
jgi:hypothetical protein